VSAVPHPLVTSDGVTLEHEFAPATSEPSMAVVLCHPHPQHGGTMRSLVISVLFAELPAAGFACLRFNFRGVEGSAGKHEQGECEPFDVIAAVAALSDAFPALPLSVVGWSFGADMALSVVDARVGGWVAIAPPLRYRSSFDAAADARPKHLVLAEHDEFRPPAEIEAEVAGWTDTTSTVVPGASHFFMGRTDRVVTETRAGLARIASG
jgi:hypothetical protein